MVLDINKEKQEISLGMKQTQANPVGQGRRPLSARRDGQRHGSQPDQLRRLHRDRRRDRRPAARQRHVVDPQDQPSQRSGRKGPGSRVQGAVASIRSAAASPWASSSWTTIRGRPTSRASTSPASSSTARSRRSPTSASSSAWKTAWKACCTSRSWPTTRSRIPKMSSRSATRSRSRSCASIPTSARSACRASASNGLRTTERRDEAAAAEAGEAARQASSSRAASAPARGPLFKIRAGLRSRAGTTGRIGASRSLVRVLAIRLLQPTMTARRVRDTRSRRFLWYAPNAAHSPSHCVVSCPTSQCASMPRSMQSLRAGTARSTAAANLPGLTFRARVLPGLPRSILNSLPTCDEPDDGHLHYAQDSARRPPPFRSPLETYLREINETALLIGQGRAGAGHAHRPGRHARPATAWSAPTCGWSSTSPAATPARASACKT